MTMGKGGKVESSENLRDLRRERENGQRRKTKQPREVMAGMKNEEKWQLLHSTEKIDGGIRRH